MEFIAKTFENGVYMDNYFLKERTAKKIGIPMITVVS
jgi:hypothetical protein